MVSFGFSTRKKGSTEEGVEAVTAQATAVVQGGQAAYTELKDNAEAKVEEFNQLKAGLQAEVRTAETERSLVQHRVRPREP